MCITFECLWWVFNVFFFFNVFLNESWINVCRTFGIPLQNTTLMQNTIWTWMAHTEFLLASSKWTNSFVLGWIVSSKRRYVGVLPSKTSECELIWTNGLYPGKQVRIKSLEWNLVPYDWCPHKKGKFGDRDRHAQRGDNVKTQRENSMWRRRIGVMDVRAKEHLELQEARREAWTRLSLRAFSRN